MEKRFSAWPVTVGIIILILVLLVQFQACETDLQEPEGPTPSLTLSSGPEETGNELKEKPELSIWVDLSAGVESPAAGQSVNELLREVPGYRTEFTANIQSVPGAGEDREPALSRLRLEMMSGKGPDLLICASVSPFKASISQIEGTFSYPRALVERKMFLPLNSYIKGAQFMEWDKLQPQIMTAGAYDGEQYLLPLSYTIKATVLDKELYAPSAELPMTWQEMAASDDPGVLYACAMGELSDALGVLGDYAKEEPSFTQDELSDALETLRLLREERLEGLWDELGDAICAPDLVIGAMNSQSFSAWTKDAYLLPVYNRSGGATANINAYAAINANAKYPDEAFMILDKLLSKAVQQGGTIYDFTGGLPVYTGLGQEGEPARGVNGKTLSDGQTEYGSEKDGWYLSDWNYSQLKAIQENITDADFYTPLHLELDAAYSDYLNAVTPEEREKIVEQHYTTLKMMLGES